MCLGLMAATLIVYWPVTRADFITFDDLDYVAHPGHLNLIAAKVEEKLIGNEEVVFDDEEMRQAALD